MKTFERLCIKDFSLVAQNGDAFNISWGEKVLTSDVTGPKRDQVIVFKNFWVHVPLGNFAEETHTFTP